MAQTAPATVGGTDINSDPNPSADPGTGDGSGIENVVTATGTYAGNTYSNDAFEDVPVVAADPLIEVTKVAALVNGDPIPADGVVAGDEIEYTFTVTNTGNVVLTGVTLVDDHRGTGTAPVIDLDLCSVTTDNVPTGDTLLDVDADGDLDQIAPSDVVTCTATYTVTQEDIDTLQ